MVRCCPREMLPGRGKKGFIHVAQRDDIFALDTGDVASCAVSGADDANVEFLVWRFAPAESGTRANPKARSGSAGTAKKGAAGGLVFHASQVSSSRIHPTCKVRRWEAAVCESAANRLWYRLLGASNWRGRRGCCLRDRLAKIFEEERFADHKIHTREGVVRSFEHFRVGGDQYDRLPGSARL